MTFANIYAEVQALRGDASATSLAQIKNWVNVAELDVWNAASWEFNRVPAQNITVTAGIGTVPTGFGKALRVYDPRGYEITYLRPDEFEALYIAAVPVPSGNAEAYTVINRAIYVGPPETGTFKISFRRRYVHYAAGSVVTQGVMSLDTDFPIWDAEYHYVLPMMALAAGGRLTNDLDVEAFQAEADRLLARMKEELVGGAEKLLRVWGESGQMQAGSSPSMYEGWGY